MPLPPDVLPLVRGFANSSFRYLFRQADNVADLIRWRKPSIARGIDFSRMVMQADTFITPGFTELESDVLLRAPWRSESDEAREVQVFILIEHQSEPDEHAVFRANRYVMQVYDKQEKQWQRAHSNTRGLRFDPVLPIVFYSGTRTWNELETMQNLVHHGDLFGAMIPSLTPVFVNLADTSADVLRSRAGTFGWILFLIQQKRSNVADFRAVLRQVVARVDRLHSRERARWEHLLWFAHALVYHAREGDERQEMADFIRATVRGSVQTEVQSMGKSIAETILDEGIEKGALANRRETLVRQLRKKFKRVPAAIEAEINATADAKKLDDWLDQVVMVKRLSDIPFAAHS